jgi:hypothetical protein
MLTELQLEDLSLKTAPGLYADIPFEEYLAAPGISKHGLDLIARSPLHYHMSRPIPQQWRLGERCIARYWSRSALLPTTLSLPR